ncbi:MAG: hypothetical protein WBA68_13735 [Alteraurantiacibacter sp.]
MASGLLAASLVLLLSLVLARWLKPSQHVAFAVLAALIASMAGAAKAILVAGLALAVASSCLALARHTLAEVFTGATCGAMARAALIALLGPLP